MYTELPSPQCQSFSSQKYVGWDKQFMDLIKHTPDLAQPPSSAEQYYVDGK